MATIEEKAKAYDIALEKIEMLLGSGSSCSREELEYVFPELKGIYDNERIRKQLLKMVRDTTGDSLWIDYNVHKEDAIAWLEAQGEQKPLGFNIGDEITVNGQICKVVAVEQKTDNKKGMNIVEEDMTPFQKKVFCIIDTTIEEEQGLKQVCDELLRLAHDEIIQNPDWTEEDEINLGKAIWYVENPAPMVAKNAMLVEWLKNLRGRVHPQPEQYWSEEDDSHIYSITEKLKGKFEKSIVITKFSLEEDLSWLKSLKNRVLPKQEWCEEDENRFNNLIFLVECSDENKPTKKGFIDFINRLKSLRDPRIKTYYWTENEIKFAISDYIRGAESYEKMVEKLRCLKPQNRWKPSEGQLECLGYAIEKAEKDWSPLTNNRIYLTLKALKEQLKKLREE